VCVVGSVVRGKGIVEANLNGSRKKEVAGMLRQSAKRARQPWYVRVREMVLKRQRSEVRASGSAGITATGRQAVR